MIIDCIADLHGSFPKLEGGDLLIVAGDLTARDTIHEYMKFYHWFHNQNYSHFIIIAGNHDRLIEEGLVLTEGLANTTYLCNSEMVFYPPLFPAGNFPQDLKRLKIWGSPNSLRFDEVNPHCAAFMKTERQLKRIYSKIPDDVDILITHTPPLQILDRNSDGHRCGSLSLRNELDNRIKPKLHIFGHIHEAYGQLLYKGMLENTSDTLCVNCSIMNQHYKPVNKAVRVIL